MILSVVVMDTLFLASSFQGSIHMQLVLVGETTGGGFETLRGDKTHCFISTNK